MKAAASCGFQFSSSSGGCSSSWGRMEEACRAKASRQLQAAFAELLLVLVNSPVFVQAQPELVRSALAPTQGGERPWRRTLRRKLSFHRHIFTSLLLLARIPICTWGSNLQSDISGFFSRYDSYLCKQVRGLAVPEEWSWPWTDRAAEWQSGSPLCPAVWKKTFIWLLTVSAAQMALKARFTVSLALLSPSVCLVPTLGPFKASQLPAQPLTNTRNTGQVSVSLGVRHVSKHLSYFAIKPTLLRRTVENDVFFLKCACFFCNYKCWDQRDFERSSWSDIVSQVVLDRLLCAWWLMLRTESKVLKQSDVTEVSNKGSCSRTSADSNLRYFWHDLCIQSVKSAHPARSCAGCRFSECVSTSVL